MNVNVIHSIKHLSEIGIDNLIKEIGLYTPIRIDTFSNTINYMGNQRVAQISSDVKQLYSLMTMNGPHYLPCASCKKELAFTQILNSDIAIKPAALVPVDIKQRDMTGHTSNPTKYCLYSDVLFIASNGSKDSDFHSAGVACKNTILDNLSFFLVELSCSLCHEHTIRCLFSLSTVTVDDSVKQLYMGYELKKLKAMALDSDIPQPTDEEKEAIKLYETSEYTLILKKVGQSPSMADMQFFDLQRYKKILKNHYRELTKSLGLHSSGIGIGAFVYLRRIFETLCEEAHQECMLMPGWNENEYTKKRFNEKMDYLGQFGRKIFPDELHPVKSKLYGVMSKGIHEYSEVECQELFPYVKNAIELILDQKLALMEKQKKIEDLTRAISKATI